MGLYLARPPPAGPVPLPRILVAAVAWLARQHFSLQPGHERDHAFYLDVGEYTPGPTVWRSEDHYLDLEVRTGRGVDLADVGELLDAVRYGLLTPKTAERAVRRAVAAVEGLARHGYDLQRWLASEGMQLTWRGA
ncbi:hypothetical protein I552_6048 [Mycobacterium xenopi 3993]|nr:hypothetical protein I552_6048 [Mycobacterium xenopi 3993]